MYPDSEDNKQTYDSSNSQQNGAPELPNENSGDPQIGTEAQHIAAAPDLERQTENKTFSESNATGASQDNLPPHDSSQLQTTVSPVASPVSGTTSQKSKKKLWTTIAVAVLVTVLIGGGAVLAYLGVYVPNRPENVLQTALFNSLEAEQVKFSGKFETKTNGDTDVLAIKVNFDGGYDTTQNTTIGSMLFMISGVELKVDARMIDDNIYVRVGDLSKIQQLVLSFMGSESSEAQVLNQMLTQAVGLVENQWIVFDSTLLEQAGMGCVTDTQIRLTENDKALMKQKYLENEFITINQHGDDTIGDVSTVKYELTVDNKKSEAYLNSLDELSVAKRIQEGCGAVFKELDQQIEADELITDGTTEFTVWVDSAAKRIVRISTGDLKLEKDSKARGTFEYNMEYNPVKVEKPSETKPALEVYTELMTLFNQTDPSFALE